MGLAKGEGDRVRNRVKVTGWSSTIFLLSIIHRKDTGLLSIVVSRLATKPRGLSFLRNTSFPRNKDSYPHFLTFG